MQARRVAPVIFVLALLARPAVAEVQLTINGGRVSLSARNATVSQILAEWAKVGKTRIVNGERVTGGPLTLELTDVSETEAIEILLRSAGGYLAAPRSTQTENASRFDRILILPTTSGSRAIVTAPPPPPVFRPPIIQPTAPSDDDQQTAERLAPNPVNTRPPVFTTFPQPPQRTSSPPTAAPTSSPSAPVGVSVPGMVVPAPPPPQSQPGAPGTPQ